MHEGARHRCDETERARDAGGNRFRVGQRDALRHEFAQHDREKRDRENDDAVADRLGIGGDQRKIG